MPELSNNDMRITFPPTVQESLLQRIKDASGMSWDDLGATVAISGRTLRDWKNSVSSMDYEILQEFSETFNIPLPQNGTIESVSDIKSRAGHKGAVKVYKKYGRVPVDEEKRKEAWREWWEDIGRYQDHPILYQRKMFRKPKLSEKLAEFVGVILGDGHISERQISVFLHSEDDKEYGLFISKLMKELFDVPVGIHDSSFGRWTSYVISRTDIVDYLIDELDLWKGNKVEQQVDIPSWIKENSRYATACVRGLFDTDGCIFDHTYTVNRKEYTYKKILYTSRSRPLLESAAEILQDEEIKTRFTKSGNDIWIDSQEMVTRYMEIIGSSNPKHLMRYSQ